jgi:hypothetical protein
MSSQVPDASAVTAGSCIERSTSRRAYSTTGLLRLAVFEQTALFGSMAFCDLFSQFSNLEVHEFLGHRW